jgi:hypothetical protein
MDLQNLRDSLISQHRAAIAMLRDAVEKYPDAQWLDNGQTNAPWQIAYHTLFFAEYYTRLTWEDYTPWLNHGVETQVPDGIPGPPDPNSDLPLIPDPFSREQIIQYANNCMENMERWINAMDLTSTESGFYWYTISKLEHQIVTIRHTQHGAAQLADRLRSLDPQGEGVKWFGKFRTELV